MASTLSRIGVPGYATLYRTSRQIVGSAKTDGAILFATVNAPKLQAWYASVGKQSVGFATRCMPDVGKLGACLRLGDDWYHYETLRGTEGFTAEQVTTRFSDRRVSADKIKSGVEATFLVSADEMNALRAFVLSTPPEAGQAHRRHHPSGGPGRTAHRAGLEEARRVGQLQQRELRPGLHLVLQRALALAAFAENLPQIRAYGQQHRIPELARAGNQMLTALRGFRERTGLGVMTGYKEIVKASSPKADAITIFNMVPADRRTPNARPEYMADPLGELTWSVPGWANGLQSPAAPRCTTLLDRAPGQPPLRQTQTERISFASFGARPALSPYRRGAAPVPPGASALSTCPASRAGSVARTSRGCA